MVFARQRQHRLGLVYISFIALALAIVAAFLSVVVSEIHGVLSLAITSVLVISGFFILGSVAPERALLILIVFLPWHSMLCIHLKEMAISPASYMLVSCWKESLLVGLLARTLLTRARAVSSRTIWFLGLTLVSVYGIGLGVYRGLPYDYPLIALRDLVYGPIVFLCVLSLNIDHIKVARVLMKAILLVAAVEILIGAAEVYLIKNPEQWWFHSYLSDLDKWADWNYFRHGVFRASGTFMSPIEYTSYLVLPLTYAIYKTVKRPYTPWIVAAGAIGVGATLGFTRNPLVVAAVMCIVMLWACQKRKYLTLFSAALLGTVWFLNVLFLMLGEHFGILDPSSAGRIPQVVDAFGLLSREPWGLGLGSVGSKFMLGFDSNLLTIIMGLGVIFGLVVIAFYFYVMKVLGHHSLAAREGSDLIIARSVFCAYLCFLGYSLFTYNLGSAVDITLFVMMGLIVGGERNECKSHFSHNCNLEYHGICDQRH